MFKSNLEIVSPRDSPNTNGIHVSASRHVVIQNCKIATGDDCVSVVTQSSDIEINKLVCGPGHGISIGCLGSRDSKDTFETWLLMDLLSIAQKMNQYT